MKRLLLYLGAVLALYGCGREEAGTAAPRGETPIDQAKQVEKAAEASKPLSDQSLTQIVKSALLSESSLDANKIDVENRSGNVTLHGVVPSEEQKEKAGRIVASVGGVRNVTNNLTIDPSASAGGTGPGEPLTRIEK